MGETTAVESDLDEEWGGGRQGEGRMEGRGDDEVIDKKWAVL